MGEPSTAASKKFMVSPDDAAAMLSVDRKTVMRFIHAGKLKASKLSPKVIRIRVSDIEKLVEDNRL